MRMYLCYLRVFCLLTLAAAGISYAQAPSSRSSLRSECTFPTASGMINVKTIYGAVGDGVTDDTTAIQSQYPLTSEKNTLRVIYFLARHLSHNKPLVWKDPTGNWQSELTFQGKSEAITTIKLSDNNITYQNPQTLWTKLRPRQSILSQVGTGTLRLIISFLKLAAIGKQ